MTAIDQSRLLVKVSRLYYEQDLTQAEIASRLRLSRQKTQRLLQEARDSGVVRIHITPLTGIFLDLEKALETSFNLREAIVVETTAYDDQPTVAREVGAGAAQYLLGVVQPRDRIVISWGGSLLGMVNALGYSGQKHAHEVKVVQGLGGLGDPNNEAHAADLTRRLAKALGGEPLLLPAPGVAGNKSTRDAFYADPYVARVLEAGRGASMAFMGIGAPRRDSILVSQGRIVMWEELAALAGRGATGDINLRYFDAAGRSVTSDLDERVVGLSLEEIKSIDHVVGVAGGAAKLKAISGALRGQLIDVLITDHITAQKLVQPEGQTDSERPSNSSMRRVYDER
jgi:DNA-binding transcriptional regulator LsrR (DeoR family)